MLDLSSVFVGHEDLRCLTLTDVHCKCMVLKSFLYLCFSPSNTACCNFVPSAAVVHQTMHISCRYKPFLQ